jgi:predicted dehydrogenase
LTRESGRHLEVFCEGVALWTDDDYLGPLHVQTSDGTHEVMGDLPEWAGLLTVPEVYAKSIAHYGLPVKAFLDGLAADGSMVAAKPGAGGYPGAGEALAAHRIVDQAYRSAAAGSVPIPSG